MLRRAWQLWVACCLQVESFHWMSQKRLPCKGAPGGILTGCLNHLIGAAVPFHPSFRETSPTVRRKPISSFSQRLKSFVPAITG